MTDLADFFGPDYFLDSAISHDRWRQNCLNLIPSENLQSPQVRRILASDMGGRYSLVLDREVYGTFMENAYRGTHFSDILERKAQKIANQLLGSKHCTLKPLSGHIAALMVMKTLTSLPASRNLILTLPESGGGYPGYFEKYMPDLLGFKTKFLPFIEDEFNLDVEGACELVKDTKPDAVVVGGSFILFPYKRLKDLSDICHDVGSRLVYDASHVMGLIMGGEFQDPLREGVDVVYGSTHKSFFGPQGGLIATNDGVLFDRIMENTTWRFIDNPHLNRIAATGQALLEMLKFGGEYAKGIVENSRRLGSKLEDYRIPLRFSELNYTESHQLVMDPVQLKMKYGWNFNDSAKELEKANIICDATGRFGTAELTRRGFLPRHMGKVASLIKAVLNTNKKHRSLKPVRRKLAALLGEVEPRFMFDPDPDNIMDGMLSFDDEGSRD